MPGPPSAHRSTGLLLERLRLATTLAHTVPGVTLLLTCCNDERITVGYGRLDAQLTPCQLRCALLADPEPGLPRLADAVRDVEVGPGMDHLGGGLYGRGSGQTGDERWFASTLTHTEIASLIATPPPDLAHDTCGVTLSPDAELGTTAVRVTSADDEIPVGVLDEVAYWVLSACLVGELDRERTRGDRA